jgi:hypothetical protein
MIAEMVLPPQGNQMRPSNVNGDHRTALVFIGDENAGCAPAFLLRKGAHQMEQLFLRQNCQTCGKPMVMASPPLGTGAWTLRCLECDPLRDDKALVWTKSELQPPKPGAD